MNKRDSLGQNIIAAALGIVVLGACGYLFGKYGFVGLDITREMKDFRDPEATGILFGWLLGMVGIPVGIATRRSLSKRNERERRRRRYREEHPEEAAAMDAERRRRADRQRQRFLRKLGGRGRS